jgi:ADP-heptose:LPS heptosyltransferase
MSRANNPPSRIGARLSVVPRAVLKRVFSGRRRRAAQPRRILIAHQLLLGDTLMLTPLLARLRRLHPAAEIVMTVSRQQLPLYASRPYGVRAIVHDPRDRASVTVLLEQGPFDLALVPGDNRHAMLALALDSRWVVALAGDRPGWKNRFADELIPMPSEPTALADMFALLAGEEDDAVFDPRDWPRPESAPFERPQRDHAVLHVGASSPLKFWQSHKWSQAAAAIESKGLETVLCAGPGEEKLIQEIDPHRRYRFYSGTLDFVQLWHLLEGARLFVGLDSGPSHLAKLTCTPTVTLYGPGSAQLLGPGRFWRDRPYRAVTVPDFPCRDQRSLFKREIHWVRRCGRSLKDCPSPACMHAIDVDAVLASCQALLLQTTNAAKTTP